MHKGQFAVNYFALRVKHRNLYYPKWMK